MVETIIGRREGDTPAMYETDVNLSTVLIITLASVASLVAVAIGVGALHDRWALACGVLAMATHSLAVRHWIVCSQRQARNTFELGRDSARAVR